MERKGEKKKKKRKRKKEGGKGRKILIEQQNKVLDYVESKEIKSQEKKRKK